MTDRTGAVQMLRRQAMEVFRLGDNDGTRQIADEALTAARADGDSSLQSEALNWLARAALRDGDFPAVERLCAQSSAAAEIVGDPEALRWPFHIRAEAARMAGDDARARPLYERSLAWHRQIGDRRMQAVELLNMSFVLRHDGDLAGAADMLGESLRTSSELGVGLEPVCLMGLAAVSAAAGDAARAARLLGASVAAGEAMEEVLDPPDQPEFDAAAEKARTALGSDDFQIAFDDGRRMSVDDAVSFALA